MELPDLPKTECRNWSKPGPTHGPKVPPVLQFSVLLLHFLPSILGALVMGRQTGKGAVRNGWPIPSREFVLKRLPYFFAACKRKEQEHGKDRGNTPKKPRLVFTDVQRRTLHAIFKENKRPSKELQITISQQLGLELSTVSNFFMNARRRSLDKWQDEGGSNSGSSSSSSSTCTKAWGRKNHGLVPRWKSFKLN